MFSSRTWNRSFQFLLALEVFCQIFVGPAFLRDLTLLSAFFILVFNALTLASHREFSDPVSSSSVGYLYLDGHLFL